MSRITDVAVRSTNVLPSLYPAVWGTPWLAAMLLDALESHSKADGVLLKAEEMMRSCGDHGGSGNTSLSGCSSAARKCGHIILFANVKVVYKPRETVAFGDLCHGLSVWEISAASQSPSSRGRGEPEEAEGEQESCDWALNVEAGEVANKLTMDI